MAGKTQLLKEKVPLETTLTEYYVCHNVKILHSKHIYRNTFFTIELAILALYFTPP